MAGCFGWRRAPLLGLGEPKSSGWLGATSRAGCLVVGCLSGMLLLSSPGVTVTRAEAAPAAPGWLAGLRAGVPVGAEGIFPATAGPF